LGTLEARRQAETIPGSSEVEEDWVISHGEVGEAELQPKLAPTDAIVAAAEGTLRDSAAKQERQELKRGLLSGFSRRFSSPRTRTARSNREEPAFSFTR